MTTKLNLQAITFLPTTDSELNLKTTTLPQTTDSEPAQVRQRLVTGLGRVTGLAQRSAP